jgi:pyruvate dehydrogenase E2 component (dihydrolipoamide acetyltransferase)
MKSQEIAQLAPPDGHVAIRMPRLSDSMQDGTVVLWLVDDGSPVEQGQEIVEIETDKATMPFESPSEGRLRIVVHAGVTASVGAVIGYVDTAAARQGPRGVRVSPLARRIAAENSIDVSGVTGTGPWGRILKKDVLQAAASATAPRRSGPVAEPGTPPAERSAPTVEVVGAGPAPGRHGDDAGYRLVPMTRSQRLVAERLAAVRATVPDFSVRAEVEMAAAFELQAGLSPLLDVRPTLNDLIVCAAARTLAQHPRLNGSYADGAFKLHDHVNIGVAVAVEDELLVPVIRDADKLPLPELSLMTRGLVERARRGTITPVELSGATFTISNLGMFGVTEFEPILNPPQAAILGVGAARHAGTEGSRTLTLTLVADHRIVYGSHAAAFIADLRTILEEPLRLLLGSAQTGSRG